MHKYENLNKITIGTQFETSNQSNKPLKLIISDKSTQYDHVILMDVDPNINEFLQVPCNSNYTTVLLKNLNNNVAEYVKVLNNTSSTHMEVDDLIFLNDQQTCASGNCISNITDLMDLSFTLNLV